MQEQFERLEKIVYDNDYDAFVDFFEKEGNDINIQNKYGWTPLHVTIRRNRKAMVEYLLKNGADIDRIDGVGWTPLMEAVMDDMPELVELLIQNGADTTIQNQRGATAFMLVQKFGRTHMLQFFQ